MTEADAAYQQGYDRGYQRGIEHSKTVLLAAELNKAQADHVESEKWWQDLAKSQQEQISDLLKVLRAIEDFGFKNPGCGYSCATMAKEARGGTDA